LSTQDSNLPSQHEAGATLNGSLINGKRIAPAIVEQLRHRIGADRFELWFDNPSCIQHTSGQSTPNCISVSADNAFSLQRIQTTFGRELRHVVDHICGPHFQIRFGIRAEAAADAAPPVESNPALPNNQSPPEPATCKPSSVTNFALNPSGSKTFNASPSNPSGKRPPASPSHQISDPSFSQSTISIQTRSNSRSQAADPIRHRRDLNSFWFGNENRLAEASVDQLFRYPGQFSPFFVYGPTGSGKTHLLESIANDYRSKLKRRRCVMLSAEQFTSLFVNSLREGSGLPMFRRKYRDLDLLVIDDVQFLAGKRATLSEFQHTIDNLIRVGKQIIVSSDRPPVELGLLGGDLSARLTAGLTCPLRYPELEGRIKIAQQMCSERNMNLAPAVIELVCERLTRDVRRISGALNRLHALTMSTGRQITPGLAQHELCDLFSMSSGNVTSMVNIETVVCELCGVKPTDLKSSSRQKQICTARMLAMYLSRQYTGSAFSEIGDYYGGRSHSTVMAAQKKVKRWIEGNEGISLPHATCPVKDVIGRLESNLRIG
jgi:chromosomal replication initiator protein